MLFILTTSFNILRRFFFFLPSFSSLFSLIVMCEFRDHETHLKVCNEQSNWKCIFDPLSSLPTDLAVDEFLMELSAHVNLFSQVSNLFFSSRLTLSEPINNDQNHMVLEERKFLKT
jgi:hypothetical protein